MRNKLIKLVQIILLVLIVGIIIVNVAGIDIEFSKNFFTLLILSVILGVVFILYLLNIIKKKTVYIFLGVLALVGILIRIFLIINVEFVLSSDFLLYYSSAKEIFENHQISNDYLSYNGYVYVFSSVLALIFKLFGPSITSVLIFNTICQIIATIFLYKIISLKNDKVIALFGSALYFLLPNVIFSNLLISTETFFMMLFMITIYLVLKITKIKLLNKKNVFVYILLGMMMSFSNNIRPVMTIFVIALIIYYILTSKKIKEFLSLILVIVVYFICNSCFNIYIENGINQETKSGALGWSFYFGSNSESCGMWTEEDSKYAFSILEDKTSGNLALIKESIKRYQNNGALESSKLMMCKYYKLWSDNNSTSHFVADLLNYNLIKIDFNSSIKPLDDISDIIVLIITIVLVASIVKEIKNKNHDNLFVEIFVIGYILSNLLVCLNGRYNLPLYPLLIITGTYYLNLKFLNQKNAKVKEIEKL